MAVEPGKYDDDMEPIELPIEVKWQLKARAAKLGITPEKYLQLLIEKNLNDLNDTI
jgi:predicted DNA-binding protein